jgi:hypothetical protein
MNVWWVPSLGDIRISIPFWFRSYGPVRGAVALSRLHSSLFVCSRRNSSRETLAKLVSRFEGTRDVSVSSARPTGSNFARKRNEVLVVVYSLVLSSSRRSRYNRRDLARVDLARVSPHLIHDVPVDGMYNCAWAVLDKGPRDVKYDLTIGKKLCQYPVLVDVPCGVRE